MKYSELIQFEPVDSVVQLNQTKNSDYAEQLINTYVISDRMAEQLNNLVFEHLQYDYQADNKGLFIVGNYGTGKSHLMGVISTVAENGSAAQKLSHIKVEESAGKIAGKFKVIRCEIGAVETSLRNIICSEMEAALSEMEVDYQFPPANEITNNKRALVEMMGAFQEMYPDKGLLFICDELLDYLRGRKEQQLSMDLGFLRELGEICEITRFRFIAGIQEMLFDNPRFGFVASQLYRVKERFEQVSIVREDIAYVVSKRLLKKNDRQKALIREHLSKFTKLYGGLTERIDEYVELFPIHPSYLKVFENVYVTEKRVILKTLSMEMKNIMDQDVPDDQPGIISYDSYWKHIDSDRTLNAHPDIREVGSKTKILIDKIETGFTKKIYKPIAKRIVQALAIHRFTTGDIHNSMGLSTEELRDQLFLYIQTPEETSDFLMRVIESAVLELRKTVSYQFISRNSSNGQYYLDLKKDIPVDELIESKADALDNNKLDEYFFMALSQVTEASEETYVPGYRIWYHEVPWRSRMVTREGYLFFGAPNERSTAQPERDFYLYFIQPFEPPKYKKEDKPEEVFFILQEKEEQFIKSVKLYAGAVEMRNSVDSATRKLYEEKAGYYLRHITEWLRKNLVNAFDVVYRGEKKKLVEWAAGLPPYAGANEIINTVASTCLEQYFNEKYPDYPHFSSLNSPMTTENMLTYVNEALNYINGRITKSGAAVLDGLVLLKDETVNVKQSGYAKWIIELMALLKPGQVVNRNELIKTIYSSEKIKDLERTINFDLEPEIFMVVLVALIKSGHIVLTVSNNQYDVMKLDDLVKKPIHDLIAFSHIKKPAGLPIPELKVYFEMFDEPDYYLVQEDRLIYGVRNIIEKSSKLLNEVVTLKQSLKDGIRFSGHALLSLTELQDYDKKLGSLKDFLETVQRYNSPAALKNFKYPVEEIENQKKNKEAMEWLKELIQKVNKLSSISGYISEARYHLPDNMDWIKEVDEALEKIHQDLKEGMDIRDGLNLLYKLKEKYIDMYMMMHQKARLGANDDNRKSRILNGKEINALRTLREIKIFSAEQLDKVIKGIQELEPCWNLTKQELENVPVCPNCRFRPKEDNILQGVDLDNKEEEIRELLDEWTGSLLNSFKDKDFLNGKNLLDPEQKDILTKFESKGVFELPIDIRLVEIIKELLKGLQQVEITVDDLENMLGNGTPLRLKEIEQRFKQLIANKVEGLPPESVRIVLKK